MRVSPRRGQCPEKERKRPPPPSLPTPKISPDLEVTPRRHENKGLRLKPPSVVFCCGGLSEDGYGVVGDARGERAERRLCVSKPSFKCEFSTGGDAAPGSVW